MLESSCTSEMGAIQFRHDWQALRALAREFGSAPAEPAGAVIETNSLSKASTTRR
jgi:hypothetical protein